MFNFFSKKTPPPSPQPVKKRQPYRRFNMRRWAGADLGNNYSDWNVSYLAANKEILSALKILIARSRDLCQNNDYIRGFLGRIRTNIINPNALHQGMKLQNKAKNPDGKPDKYANDLIEIAWDDFCKKKNCTVTKNMTMADVIAVSAQTECRDGSILIRKVYDKSFKYGFALQLLDIDYLDTDYNVENKIIGGIEYNKYKAPIVFHFLKEHPGDHYSHERIPIKADDIIYLYNMERPEQLFAPPWFCASLARMRMLSGFEESNAIGTRVAAAKMGFYSPEEGGAFLGDAFDETDTDTDPEYVSEVTPGMIEELPAGVDFKTFDPGYPNTGFAEFTNHMLRGAASGVNASYINFANDPGAANFASMRQSEVSESDMWMEKQSQLINHLMQEVFATWLKIQLTNQTIPLPLNKFDKFNKPSFVGKRWKSYKPVEDAKAKEILYNNGVITLGDWMAEQGADHDDTMDRRQREKEKQTETGFNAGDDIQESQPKADDTE